MQFRLCGVSRVWEGPGGRFKIGAIKSKDNNRELGNANAR
jgi:hypothetical protein